MVKENNTMKSLVKIKDFWKRGLWQKILILLMSAVIGLVLILTIAHNWGKTSAGVSIVVILFFGMMTCIIAIPVQIVIAIKNHHANKQHKLSEEQRIKDQETAQAVLDLIKEGSHPPMQTDLLLPQGEICYAAFGVAIYKEKNLTKGLAYSGFRYRLKIAKGLSYTVGTINPNIERIKVQYLDDKGILYITNKRLIYKGDKKTENIKLSDILHLEMIPGGVLISKNQGSIKAYNFVTEYKLFPVYMSALMNKEE